MCYALREPWAPEIKRTRGVKVAKAAEAQRTNDATKKEPPRILNSQSDQVVTQLDRLHYIMGQVEPARPAGTAQWLGRLLMSALEMWADSEAYIDEFDGESVNDFVPSWAALVGTTQPSGFTYFGSISQVSENGFEESHLMHFCLGCTTTSTTSRPLIASKAAPRFCLGTSPAGR